jgi:hypothetical protein
VEGNQPEEGTGGTGSEDNNASGKANQATSLSRQQACSDGEAVKGRIEVGLEMEKLFQANQFRRLHNAGVADHLEPLLFVLAVLRQLDQRTQARRIDEIDMGEVDQQGFFAVMAMGPQKFNKLLVGVGVQLASETEQLALGLLFKATTQGDRQSLQIVNSSSPPNQVWEKL